MKSEFDSSNILQESEDWQQFNRGVLWNVFCPQCNSVILRNEGYDSGLDKFKSHWRSTHSTTAALKLDAH